MVKFSSEKVEEIRERADIERVVGRSVQLTRRGQNLWGLCPFHGEKTPSFSVSPQKRLFYCFGCHLGGDVFDFLMRLEGMEFPEAVRTLAEETGVELPEDERRGSEDAKAHEARTRLYEANELACRFFEHELTRDPRAQAYLQETRGLAPETIRAFRLGWAPPEWDRLVAVFEKRKVPMAVALELGLLGKSKEGRLYDRLRGRIIFPILVQRGQVAGFGARRADWIDHEGAKYLNSIESPVYEKSGILYGFAAARDEIRRRRGAILVEGYLDVMSLWQVGLQNAVAVCGTALSERHAGMLSRLTKKVFSIFDGDAAGRAATAHAARLLLSEGVDVQVVELPEGEDPDSFTRKEGADSTQKLIDAAPSAVDFFLAKARTENGGGGVAGTVRALEAVKPMILAIADPLARDVAIAAAGRALGIDERVLRRHLRGEPAGIQRRDAHQSGPGPWTATSAAEGRPGGEPSKSAPAATPAASAVPPPSVVELALIRALIDQPETTVAALNRYEATDAFTHPTLKATIRAGLDAIESGKKFDAPLALEVAKEEGGANAATLAAIQKALMDTAPETDDVAECVKRLLTQQHKILLKKLKDRAAKETDPEVQMQLALEVKAIMASRSSWEEKN
ncbi:MAG: DNA primase [Deltaproteobacteria bacterium]|nr:DNA primase [Deltaproteobacteria bacterium]